MPRFRIIVFLLLLAFNSHAQDSANQNDSLLQIINNPNTHDTTRFNARMEYGNVNVIFRISYWDSLATDCEKKFHNNSQPQVKKSILNTLSSCYNNLGFISCNIGEVEKGIDYFNQGLNLQRENSDMEGVASSLSNLGYVYENLGDLDTAMTFYQRAADTRRENGDMDGYCTALNMIGVAHFDQGQTDKALEVYNKILLIRIQMNDMLGVAEMLNNMGMVYLQQAKIEIALDYFHEAMKMQDKGGDREGVAASLNNIAYIFYNQGETEIAKGYFEQSLEIFNEIQDEDGKATAYTNLGQIAADNGEFEKALIYYRKAIHISALLGDQRDVAELSNNVGDIFAHKAKLMIQSETAPLLIDQHIDSAFFYMNSSLKMSRMLGGNDGITRALNNIVDFRYFLFEAGFVDDQQKIQWKKESENMISESMERSLSLGYPENTKEAARLASLLYEDLNRTQDAFDAYKLYVEMQDSISNSETQKTIVKQQAKHQYEKEKAIEKAKHLKLLAVEQEKKRIQQIVIITSVIGIVFLIVFGFVTMKRLRITRKQKSIIEVQKEKVEKAHQELEIKNEEILDSITYAKRIQSAILPQGKIVNQFLPNSFVFYKPKDIVAGDFYWLELKDNKILFAAADCTGHGVPGAMVSVVCNNGLNRSVREHNLTDPGKILDKTREIVIQEFEKSEEEVKDGMDIALCSLEGNKLNYAGAHNPLWIIRKGATEVEEIKADKQPIGKFSNVVPFSSHSLELIQGDTIYIFSDGFADQFGGDKGKKFKAKNFKSLLLSIQNESMVRQKELLDTAFEKWRGQLEQLDDVCVIGVRV